MPRIVLASASPRRRDLLRQIGLEFEVIPADIEEDAVRWRDPGELVRKLALSKAEKVAASVRGALVVGADTIVLLDGEVLGKPRSREEARGMLGRLAGKEHQVFTGLAVVDTATGKRRVDHEETRVWMRPLGFDQIAAYVASGEPLDKAGAYAVQGLGAVLVERLEGCYFNVVGLPVPRLAKMLEEFGVKVLG